MYNYLLHLRTYLIIKQKQFVDAISLRKTESYTRFVILCEPRTGSTLLHTYLNYHPHIRSYGEILRENAEENKSIAHEPVKTYVFKPHAAQLKAVGLKLFYSYYQAPPFHDAFQEVIKMQDVKVIHLIREDILQQYVSHNIAKQSGEWSASRSDSKNEYRKLLVDLNHLKQFVTAYYQKRALIKGYFAHHEKLDITYERLKDDTEHVLAEVQQFLKVEPRKLLTLLQKQNTKPLEHVVENYAEARQVVNDIEAKLQL